MEAAGEAPPAPNKTFIFKTSGATYLGAWSKGRKTAAGQIAEGAWSFSATMCALVFGRAVF
eukprot:6383795-Amphidinium_carterae.1